MTIELEIQQETAVPQGAEDALQAAVDVVLKKEQVLSAALTILLTDDETVRTLNRQFRSEDTTTDVLSFPFDDQVPSGQELEYLGDIAISVPYAIRQAAARGHSATAELQLLAVHGILHLLGYDHVEADEKRAMWAVQRSVLDQLHLAHVEPTEGD